ncbi:MAG: hypothetical protein J7L63_05350 [Thermoplasmata archaeon]|nr:hypothetical protein [Thermoplasmata archaeon]
MEYGNYFALLKEGKLATIVARFAKELREIKKVVKLSKRKIMWIVRHCYIEEEVWRDMRVGARKRV